jgi:hypothetical protein
MGDQSSPSFGKYIVESTDSGKFLSENSFWVKERTWDSDSWLFRAERQG